MMAVEQGDPRRITPEAQAFVRGLIDVVAHRRLPDLFRREHPDALYRVPDRHGVSVLVVRTSGLQQDELVALMQYRLAQYLAVHFVDPQLIYEQRLEHEPLTGVSPHDVHVIAGSAATGELLCYAVLKAAAEMPAGATLRTRERPLFPVETIHGWGIFNRLRILPDLPAAKLCELGRFVKNQRLHTFDELGVRGPVEVGVALFRALIGPLRLELEAIIGDLEEGVAKQNLDFFHVPMVVLHGTVPYEAEASYFSPRYQQCTVYPFAMLSADCSRAMLARLDSVEQALAQPGRQGLLALFALKRALVATRSTLEPAEGLPALTTAGMPQRDVTMGVRRHLLDAGEYVRSLPLFSGLSVAEATVLGTCLKRMVVAPGQTIVHQGDIGTELYVIESGQAEVRLAEQPPDAAPLAVLGAGEYFGEVALVTGAERTADVVARTSMSLLVLSKDDYARYLAHTIEVEQQITHTAISRMTDTMRKARMLPP
jgi:hypothetical protein